MSGYIFQGTYNLSIITMIFVLSTLYGLNFYYEGYDYGSQINLQDKPITFWGTIIGSTGIDSILSIFAALNPFILMKAFFFAKLGKTDYASFQMLDIFILRPIGWMATMLLWEWIINKVRGISG